MEGLPPLPTAPGEGPAHAGGLSGTAMSAPSRALPDSPPFKVFIGNIPYDATAQQMGEVFYPELQVSTTPRIAWCGLRQLCCLCSRLAAGS